MLKILKNQDGFAGLMGLIIVIVVIGIMSAMVLPTFTAKMNYKQAKYTVGVVRTIENAENAYMAKNGSFANLSTLAAGGYLSSNFLISIQPPPSNPYWANTYIANQTVNICIDNSNGCPNNPGVGNNGYFLGIYNIPTKYQTYIEHELPGSGSVGSEQISYVAPIPSSPPVANAQNANYANYANRSSYEDYGTFITAPNSQPSTGGFQNTSSNLIYNVAVWGTCWSSYPRIYGFDMVGPGGTINGVCGQAGFTIVGVYQQ